MSSQQTPIVNSSSINAPLNRHRRYRHHLRASCRLEDEHEDDEQQNQHLKNEITQLKDKIDKLEKGFNVCHLLFESEKLCVASVLPLYHLSRVRQSVERAIRGRDERRGRGRGRGEDGGDRKSKKNEIFFRCPTCRGNVTGVLQVFPP